MKKRILFLMIFTMLLSAAGCGSRSQVYLQETEETEVPTETEVSCKDSGTEQSVSESCYVYVCGAVISPGVYELPSGSRIFEAVALAGGLAPSASEDSINQAEEISDGQMVKVLTVEEAADGSIEEAVLETDGRININTADINALMTLPGIGVSKAESIISYREEHGGFSAVEDIMKITGIKEGVYAKIKDHITVN